jgi:hypothetical protein
MNCLRLDERLIPYLDGKLAGSDEREVEAHLAACTACRRRADEFRAVTGLLDELPVIEPSPAFDVRVRARVAAAPSRQGWLAWLTPSPRVALSATLLLMLTVWITGPKDVDRYDHANNIPAQNSDEDFRMIKDLPVLEDYDVLSNFEPLADLPQQPPVENQIM